MREGQTLAVAGLLQTNLGTDSDQLPFLGNIPVLNRLTGFDRTSAGEQELVVLITPELVLPMKKGSHIPRLPGSDLFEPSDLEFYLLGRLEGRHTGDFRQPGDDRSASHPAIQPLRTTIHFWPVGLRHPDDGPEVERKKP